MDDYSKIERIVEIKKPLKYAKKSLKEYLEKIQSS